MFDFKGKTAIITGAASGFGAEFAKAAAGYGMKTLLADIDSESLNRSLEAVRSLGGTAEAMVVDVSLESEVDAMVARAMELYGRIDVLINNAGVAFGGDVTQLPIRDWEWIIGVNNLSHIYSMKKVIPIMETQGTPCYILNVASLAGLITMGKMPAYFATKSFAVSLSESVNYDLRARDSNVHISVFCPSFVQTDLHNSEKHRPVRFSCPNDPYYSSAHYKFMQEYAEFVITTGTPLAPIAEYVFDAMKNERFYIQPHNVAKFMIKHRFRNLLKGRNPNYQFIKDVDEMAHGKYSMKQLMRLFKNM